MEEWKDIEGYEGLYQVSNYGRVKSLGRCITYIDGRKKEIKEKMLHLFTNELGYYHVSLSKCGVVKRFKVHRLVAKAFLENPNNYPAINHRDENPQNNRVENLEWCTIAYNNSYGTARERGRAKQLNDETKSKIVMKFDINGNLIEVYPSASEAARQNNSSPSQISRACLGGFSNNGIWNNIYKHKGYIWRYK